jgi:hypothetical protein
MDKMELEYGEVQAIAKAIFTERQALIDKLTRLYVAAEHLPKEIGEPILKGFWKRLKDEGVSWKDRRAVKKRIKNLRTKGGTQSEVKDLMKPLFPEEEKIHLESGREILIDEIYIYYTYIGILVGDPVECSANIRSKLRSSILNKFPWFQPLYIFDEGLTVLPAYTCVADVWSPAPMNPKNHASFLHICWFTNDIARPIPPMIKEILNGIVWEAWAEDGRF